MRMPKEKKKPWLAALLNFVVPGLGYVYAGKRQIFGIGLVIWGIIALGWYFTSKETSLLLAVDSFVISILLAYDGYKTAEEVNAQK